MKIGYARVSTDDQNLDLQKDALTKAGCSRIYEEHKSGKSLDRPELDGIRIFGESTMENSDKPWLVGFSNLIYLRVSRLRICLQNIGVGAV